MEEQEFRARYMAQLNKAQQEAVQTVEGNVLLLAVPGSGKTTVLVTRLGYMLLVKKVRPENILTLTYTVAATKDMAQRFVELFGEELGEKLEFRTINGICQRILHYYGNATGKTMYELVTDEKELSRMVAGILQEMGGEYPTESEVSTARMQISYCKNRMLSKDERIAYGKKMQNEELPKIYARYEQLLKTQSKMDYDDQMVYAYRLLQMVPEVLAHFQEQFRYFCVDEAQDTSKIQHEIIKLLAKKEGNLFMVGDEDQSIYGFRAAYPEALLEFETDHEDAKVLVMNTNYRSNAHIVRAAQTVIGNNKGRHEKHMEPAREPGQGIRFVTLNQRANQYQYLAKVAENATSQVAILYRDNESAVPLVDLLDRQGIAYRLKNAEAAFFTNRVVKDILSILMFAKHPKDTELFYSFYYKIGLYLTKEQAEKLCRVSEERNCPVLEAIEHMFGVKGNTLGNCRSMRTHFKNMVKEPPARAISRIRRFMGYGDYLERVCLDDGKINTLLQIAYRETSVDGFLMRMERLQQLFQYGGTRTANVLLSTIHSSKGLEYDEVYLMDVIDGVLPKRTLDGNIPKGAELEEERRLFYVGMTRAKERLHIFKFKGESAIFVKEIGKTQGEEKIDFAPAVGMAVVHKAFGEGTIADIVYEGKRPVSVVVSFSSGMKKFMFPMVFSNGYMKRK
ncbi:DNA helicase-2 / ATP-dependent DNA helicase PcrA [Lachnospiraceae bacterium XBB1006]|nr:DNA helicase-2 / ATP-dependent DNA helicase PcrA [Lachnospiraceae bacterium XBB1006]